MAGYLLDSVLVTLFIGRLVWSIVVSDHRGLLDPGLAAVRSVLPA
jgi:hypothetical protein